jgi:hypothetical protein
VTRYDLNKCLKVLGNVDQVEAGSQSEGAVDEGNDLSTSRPGRELPERPLPVSMTMTRNVKKPRIRITAPNPDDSKGKVN